MKYRRTLMTSQLCFFAAGSWEKDTESGTAVTSLSSFLFRDNFKMYKNYFSIFWVIFNFTNHSVSFLWAQSHGKSS